MSKPWSEMTIAEIEREALQSGRWLRGAWWMFRVGLACSWRRFWNERSEP